MSRMRPHYRIGRRICHCVFTTLLRGRTFGVRNVPVEGGVLLVCNHQSFLDPMLATLALPRECCYMARDSLFRNETFARLIRAFNAFPIKRGTADLKGIREALQRLKAGMLVTAFPEGTRTLDGSVGPMHAGTILMSRRAKVPVVPATILGAYKAWPRHARFPRPVPIIVSYGEPLWPAQAAELSDEQAITVVRDRIVDMYERYRRHPLLAHGGR